MSDCINPKDVRVTEIKVEHNDKEITFKLKKRLTLKKFLDEFAQDFNKFDDGLLQFMYGKRKWIETAIIMI